MLESEVSKCFPTWTACSLRDQRRVNCGEDHLSFLCLKMLQIAFVSNVICYPQTTLQECDAESYCLRSIKNITITTSVNVWVPVRKRVFPRRSGTRVGRRSRTRAPRRVRFAVSSDQCVNRARARPREGALTGRASRPISNFSSRWRRTTFSARPAAKRENRDRTWRGGRAGKVTLPAAPVRARKYPSSWERFALKQTSGLRRSVRV